MSIRENSQNLQKLYDEMSQTFSSYQSLTKLSCPPGCGKCCLNPDIEASPFEMLPFALKVFDEGKLEEWMDLFDKNEQNHCILFVPSGVEGRGQCGHYNERPSVCRMFGVAGYFNKHHEKILSICKHLPINPEETISADGQTPMISEWSSILSTFNPDLNQPRMPINRAINQALKKVALFASYQDSSY